MARYITPISEDDIQDIVRMSPDNSQQEIAEYIGCSATSVSIYRRKLGLPTKNSKWNKERRDHLAEVYCSGLKLEDIAIKLGMSLCAISQQLTIMRHMGYQLPNRERGKARKKKLPESEE